MLVNMISRHFIVQLTFHCLAFFDFLLARPICSQTRFGEALHLRDEGVIVTSHFWPITHFLRGERFARVRLMCQEFFFLL